MQKLTTAQRRILDTKVFAVRRGAAFYALDGSRKIETMVAAPRMLELA